MKFQLRQRDRRALGLLILAVVIFGLANKVLLPAYDRMSTASDLAADNAKQLRRYRRAELRKGQYTDLLKLANDRVTKNESVVIAASNVSLASAEFQTLIEGIGNKVGLMVGQRMIGTPRRLDNIYAELPMTLGFDSTPGQLVAFLDELRSLPRFVNVRNLQVAPISPVLEAPKGSDLTKNVRVTITVAALMPADLVKPAGGAK
jgi:Tfp pilus assembly protein PilO